MMTRLLLSLAGFAGLLLVGSAGAGGAAIRVVEVPVGVVPSAAGQWAVSPDLRRLAYVEPTGGGGARVVVDGRPGEVFAEVRVESLRWSGDGKRVAYMARSTEGWHAVVGGHRTRAYDDLGPAVAFSADGSRYGFTGSRGGAAYVVIDDAEHGPYGGANDAPPCFSPDGKRVFYTNWVGGRGFIRSDGRTEQAAGPYGFVTHAGAVFSADSAHLAYPGSDTKAGTRHVVVDGVPTGGYRANGLGLIALSADGRRLAFAYQPLLPGDRTGDWVLVVDGNEGKPLAGKPVSLVFSPDGKRIATRLESHNLNEQWVVLDGAAGKRYMRVSPDAPMFSPDGDTCAYVGWNHVGPWKATWPPPPRGAPDPDGQSFVVVNGVEAAKWVAVGRLAFLPDGRLAYGAIDARGISFLVLDGVPHSAPFMAMLVVKDKDALHGLGGRAVGQRDWAVVRVEVNFMNVLDNVQTRLRKE